ncbi:hypothetical protein L7F22_064904 [Adiantum nelumboides]|nr:hypothetical protein [Adiantum nelumboides]
MCRWWAEELAVVLETFLRLPSFLPASFRASLLQPEQLQLLHCNVPEPLLPHALRICSPADASLSCKEGVPAHPLFKHLAFALSEWMASTVFPRTLEHVSGLSGDHLVDKLKAWAEKIPDLLAKLQKVMQQAKLHLQLQEPLLLQLREKLPDTAYTAVEELFFIKDASSMKAENSLIDGSLVLLNKAFLYVAQLDPSYISSNPTRKHFTIVLHDPSESSNASRTGVLLPRDICEEGTDVCIPAVRLHCAPESSQPLKIMAKMLEELTIEGVKALFGFRSTIGSVEEALLPARSLLMASFLEANKIDVAGTKLTTGARALSKHVHQCSSGWWGNFSGNGLHKDLEKLAGFGEVSML